MRARTKTCIVIIRDLWENGNEQETVRNGFALDGICPAVKRDIRAMVFPHGAAVVPRRPPVRMGRGHSRTVLAEISQRWHSPGIRMGILPQQDLSRANRP